MCVIFDPYKPRPLTLVIKNPPRIGIAHLVLVNILAFQQPKK